jgi:transposase
MAAQGGIAMTDLFLLSEAQMRRIEPFFPLSHGVPRVDDRRVISGIVLVISAGIGLMTPNQVHYGQADAIHAARQNTLDGAFNRNPKRFVRMELEPPAKPFAIWITPPSKTLNIQA